MNVGPFVVQTSELEPGSLYTRYTVIFAGVELGSQVSKPDLEQCLTRAREALQAGRIKSDFMTAIVRAVAERSPDAFPPPALRLPDSRKKRRHARTRNGQFHRSAA